METAAVPLNYYLILSGILFTIGVTGVLIKRNPIVIFMCIELMLNAVNLTFVAFSRYHQSLTGQLVVIFVLAVAAAEVSVGLGIIVSIFRARVSINIDEMDVMRG
jgi:NADH-quinone oxidoreductase subunit K